MTTSFSIQPWPTETRVGLSHRFIRVPTTIWLFTVICRPGNRRAGSGGSATQQLSKSAGRAKQWKGQQGLSRSAGRARQQKGQAAEGSAAVVEQSSHPRGPRSLCRRGRSGHDAGRPRDARACMHRWQAPPPTTHPPPTHKHTHHLYQTPAQLACVFSKWPMPASRSLIMRQDSLPCTLHTSAARLRGETAQQAPALGTAAFLIPVAPVRAASDSASFAPACSSSAAEHILRLQ